MPTNTWDLSMESVLSVWWTSLFTEGLRTRVKDICTILHSSPQPNFLPSHCRTLLTLPGRSTWHARLSLHKNPSLNRSNDKEYEFWSRVPQDLTNEVFSAYSLDFEMFGYSLTGYLESLGQGDIGATEEPMPISDSLCWWHQINHCSKVADTANAQFKQQSCYCARINEQGLPMILGKRVWGRRGNTTDMNWPLWVWQSSQSSKT